MPNEKKTDLFIPHQRARLCLYGGVYAAYRVGETDGLYGT